MLHTALLQDQEAVSPGLKPICCIAAAVDTHKGARTSEAEARICLGCRQQEIVGCLPWEGTQKECFAMWF